MICISYPRSQSPRIDRRLPAPQTVTASASQRFPIGRARCLWTTEARLSGLAKAVAATPSRERANSPLTCATRPARFLECSAGATGAAPSRHGSLLLSRCSAEDTEACSPSLQTRRHGICWGCERWRARGQQSVERPHRSDDRVGNVSRRRSEHPARLLALEARRRRCSGADGDSPPMQSIRARWINLRRGTSYSPAQSITRSVCDARRAVEHLARDRRRRSRSVFSGTRSTCSSRRRRERRGAGARSSRGAPHPLEGRRGIRYAEPLENPVISSAGPGTAFSTRARLYAEDRRR